MTKQQSAMEAEELSQLARLLFDAAASKWYTAAVIDVLNGASAALLSVFDLAGGAALIPAIVEVMLLMVSAALRMWAESQYDTADTMRRQSVLSEALGWPISAVQL